MVERRDETGREERKWKNNGLCRVYSTTQNNASESLTCTVFFVFLHTPHANAHTHTHTHARSALQNSLFLHTTRKKDGKKLSQTGNRRKKEKKGITLNHFYRIDCPQLFFHQQDEKRRMSCMFLQNSVFHKCPTRESQRSQTQHTKKKRKPPRA
jgi:hypothetical protein